MASTSSAKSRVPVVEGWFTTGEEPRLLGLRDPGTDTYFFPRDPVVSRPPQAWGGELEEVELGRRGTLWSFTTNHYQPPEPFIPPDPFEPYTVAAVQLHEERMVILGQLAVGVDPASLEVGAEMELVVEPLYEDDEHEYLVWKWKPVGCSAGRR